MSNDYNNTKTKAMFQNINNQIKDSQLFVPSSKYKIRFNIPVTILIYFLLWILGIAIGRFINGITLNVLLSKFALNDSVCITLRKLIVSGTQIVLFILWVKFVERRPIKSIGFQTNRGLKSYFAGILVGFTSITVITIILIFTGQVTLEVNKVTLMPLLTIIGILSLGWIIQSASEEISIRGWLIHTLGTSGSPYFAIGITAIIFGILHLFSSGVTILSFLNLTLSGIFFAGYAIYTENIVGVCGLHFAWNFALANIYGFSVSGFTSNGETIFQATQIGYKFYTGGNFGPEGGFITTIILLIGISILVLKFIKKYCA